MPYSRKRPRSAISRTYRPRRSGYRRRRYTRKRPRLRGRTGFPTQLYTKLKYTQTVTLNGASGTISGNVFSGNSLFDPDASGIGHQPYFYDQLTGVYNSYIVYASKIEIMSGTNSSVDARIVCRPAIPSTAVGNMDLECERPNSKCWFVKPEGTSIKHHHFARTKNVFGSQSKILDENFQAAVTTNPNNRWYWLLAAQATDQTSSVICQLTVTITYYARFFDRTTLSQS